MKLLAITLTMGLSTSTYAVAQDMPAEIFVGEHRLTLENNGDWNIGDQLGMVTEGGGIRIDENGVVWVFTGADWVPIILPDYIDIDDDRPTFREFGDANTIDWVRPQIKSINPVGSDVGIPNWGDGRPGWGNPYPIWPGGPCTPGHPLNPWVLCAPDYYFVAPQYFSR